EQTYAVIEMIGEWNDCLHNDIAIFKRNVLDILIENGIYKYILIGENVLNFHASDDCYYEEWAIELNEEDGWICLVNMLDHVWDEMQETGLDNFMYFGEDFNNVIWRPNKPQQLLWDIEQRIDDHNKERIYI
ncbi:MAG: hypothetical protein MK212_16310, partial [Saprospiraceae bacterium]|nr:hypothetical protein [Saprospiraceae bacterium]